MLEHDAAVGAGAGDRLAVDRMAPVSTGRKPPIR